MHGPKVARALDRFIQKFFGFFVTVVLSLKAMKPDRHLCECQITHPAWFGPSIRDVPVADDYYDLVWFYECGACKALWLRVLFEAPHLPKAGHWYDALINNGGNIVVLNDDAIQKLVGTRESIGQVFSKATIRFRGGSYFGGIASPTDLIPTRLV